MKISHLIALICAGFTFSAQASIYTQYQQKANDTYERLSLDEKIGQLLLPSYALLATSMSPNGELCEKAVNNLETPKAVLLHNCGLDQIRQYHIGNVLTGGDPYFNAPTLAHWSALNALAVEEHGDTARYDSVLLLGNDAVHGNMHVEGAVLFPHNIGLGVTHDPALVRQIGSVTGQDSLASGFNWAYAPTLAVAQDLRWGRTYESFGEDPLLVKSMAYAYVSGLQDIQNGYITGVLATAKHFLGDGATQYGIDEGDDQYTGTESAFLKENEQGYKGAKAADVGSLMVSYSAIDGDNTRMHLGGKWNILPHFKNQFNGFAVSDWNGATRAAYFYDSINNGLPLTLPQILAKSMNAGVDMFMLGPNDNTDPFNPNSPLNFASVSDVFHALKTAIQTHLISDTRLKDAVTRVLVVKYAMQSAPSVDYAALQRQERHLALKAAEESLVLLQNNNRTLPIQASTIQNVIFIGNTDDLGSQNGGWSIYWQGQKGDAYFTGPDQKSSGAMTLQQGVMHALRNQSVHYYFINDKQNTVGPAASLTLNSRNTIIIAALSEIPYAEFMGDIGNSHVIDRCYVLGGTYGFNQYLGLPQNQFLGLTWSPIEEQAIRSIRMMKNLKDAKLITVVYSGRPVILSQLTSPTSENDAVIAAFLPGTVGGKALGHALFGQYCFRSGANGQSNTLTFPWPRDMNDVANHFKQGSLFPVGYGLSDC